MYVSISAGLVFAAFCCVYPTGRQKVWAPLAAAIFFALSGVVPIAHYGFGGYALVWTVVSLVLVGNFLVTWHLSRHSKQSREVVRTRVRQTAR